jgi:hypothetical protein
MPPRTRIGLLSILAAGLMTWGQGLAAGVPGQKTFATAEEAASALAAAARAHDGAALRAIFGPDSDRLLDSGDRVDDEQAQQRFADAYDQHHEVAPQGPGRATIQVGPNDWPLPIPLVQQDGTWHFDTAAGAQEIIDRRIGRNELETVRTMLAYVDAQQDYFDRMKQQTGTGLFAQRLVSTPGHQDGLYWPAESGAVQSPLGPLVALAQEEGYPGEIVGGRPMAFNGYLFRILHAQGPYAPGGAKNYVRNRHMTEGFGLIAWPAQYGASGIMTFIVDQDGIVFQKDLGGETTVLAAEITRFDPDLSWTRIDLSGD